LIFAIALSYSLSRLRTLVEKVKKQKAEESIRYEEQLRKQQEEVGRRNHQMSVFYEVMQATRDQKDLRSQLELIAHTIEDVFGTSGIRRCAFFLPNAVDKNYSNVLAKSSSTIRSLTSNEEASLMWAMKHATSVVLSDVPLISYQKGDHLR